MTQRISLALLLLLGAAVAGPVEYEFIPLPGLQSDDEGWGFQPNDRRQVSGWLFTSGLPHDRAAFWDVAADGSATVTDIGLVSGRRMFGRGLNNHGHMVGFSWISGAGGFAFRYTGGTPVELENAFDTLDTGTFQSAAIEINDDGWASGSACGSATGENGPWSAVLWDPSGSMHDLGTVGGEWSFGFGVNARGLASGQSEFEFSSFNLRGFRYDPVADTMETLDVLPGLGHMSAGGRGINNHGDIAGSSSEQMFLFGPSTLGVIWYADGTVRQLDGIGTPGTDDIYAYAWDINDACWTTGSSSLGVFPDVAAHPMLWTPDGATIDLLQFLPSGVERASADGISNTGWISGLYFVPGADAVRPYLLRPTPATQIGMLMDQVDRLDLGRIGRGMNVLLGIALAKVEDGKPHIAGKLLAVFALEVRLLERLRRIDDIEADSLLAVVKDAAAALKGE